MAVTIRKFEETPHDLPGEKEAVVAQNPPPPPTGSKTQDKERAPAPPLGEQIRAHTNRPHKGDVGRPGTNEEVFQGSKGKELK
ncbi:MAG: hypothetical protein ACLGXA_24060 [Acidobacteriota bacterium]